MKQKISIIVPVYNEAKSIPNIYKRLNTVTEKLTDYQWEYIFVNDGSTDGSREWLSNYVKNQNKIQ